MARKALGRGLDALLGGVKPAESKPVGKIDPNDQQARREGGSDLPLVNLTDISPNPDQPRKVFDRESLQDLSRSIKAQGLLQPLLVCPAEDGKYYIIAGERRWQASKLAGLTQVPVIVREVTGTERLALALIENIQREDLNCIEEAAAYQRLLEEFELTQSQVAEAVGRDRATVANLVRLLKLPEPVQTDLIEDRLSMGHARALLGLTEHPPKLLAARAKVLANNLTVRQTEALVNKMKKGQAQTRGPSPAAVQLKAEEEKLRRRLGTKVSITKRGESGRIVIEFYSEEDLDRLLEVFSEGD